MARILVVEDEPCTLNVLSTLLKTEGYEVTASSRGDQAVQFLESERFDLMLSDIRMTPVDGMELLKRAHEVQPQMAVIMLTGYGTVETAVASLKLGAFDYITKPFQVDNLFLTVQKALEAATHTAVVGGNDPPKDLYCFDNLVAASESMRKVCEMIERVAQTEVMVLIEGEDGVGKALAANTLHSISKRRKGPFVRVNCAETTEAVLAREIFGPADNADGTAGGPGALERSSEGTLYIEALHAMPLAVQERLLVALQEKTIRSVEKAESVTLDFRLVTSTNAPLEFLVKAGNIRQELYYRLSALPIEIKPLRERRDDILPLFFHFLRQIIGAEAPLPVLTPEACAILEQYRWPGNARELENVVQHVLSVSKSKIGKEALPPAMVESLRASGLRMGRKTSEAEAYRARSLKAFLHNREKANLLKALESSGGDLDKAAQALQISTTVLQKKLATFNLHYSG